MKLSSIKNIEGAYVYMYGVCVCVCVLAITFEHSSWEAHLKKQQSSLKGLLDAEKYLTYEELGQHHIFLELF